MIKQVINVIVPAHSMEEAEVLCDRLGIFVDGDFQCLGNPKEVDFLVFLSSQKVTFLKVFVSATRHDAAEG